MNAIHILHNIALLVATLEAAPAITEARTDDQLYSAYKMNTDDGIFDLARAEVTTMDGKSAGVKIVVRPEERNDKLKTITGQNYQIVYMPKGAEVIANIKPGFKSGIEFWNGGISSKEAVKMLRVIDSNTKYVNEDMTGLFMTPQIYKIDDVAAASAGIFTSDPYNKNSPHPSEPSVNAWVIGSSPATENSIKSNYLINNAFQGVFPLTKLNPFQLINGNFNPFVTFH